VYRIDRTGTVELVPGSQRIVFPNGFAFDNRGDLYATESFSMVGMAPTGQGGIWRIARDGTVEPWLRHPLLTGVGIGGNPPVGANGIAFLRGELFVANTDKGLVVRIPIEKDGSPGEPTAWKQVQDVPESALHGKPLPVMPDGLALDVHGNVYVVVLSRNAIVRIDARGQHQDTVAALNWTGTPPDAPLDTPASLAFGTGAGEQQNLFVTNLGWMARLTGLPLSWPGPALVKVPAGAPGLPLH
jgi:sugar lactone lactonase YvrE